VGNKKRSVEDLINCQVGRGGNAYFQEGNEMRSLKNPIDCQEGRSETSCFQVGKEDEVRLSESLGNSEERFHIIKEC
jgi:hypothetical protein